MPIHDDQQSHQPNPRYTYIVALVAALGGFLFGYDLNIIGAAMIYLREQFAMSPWLFGFSTGSAIIGCIFGPFLAMVLGNSWGRKRCLYLAAGLFFVSALGSAFPETLSGVTGDPVWGFNIYRILGGLGIGFSSVLAPMYIAEIAPAERRGRLVLMYQLAITIGAMLGFLFTAACANWIADTNLNWRWMFGSEALPAVLFAFLLIMVPRSPRWLAEKGLDDESLEVLTRVNGPERAGEILREIRKSIDAESGSFLELFKPGIRYALLIACILAVFNNWTGWSSIAYYLPTLMQMGGYPDPADAISSSMALFLLNMLLTFVAIATVDRWGRKKLWILGSVWMIFSTMIVGYIFYAGMTGPIVIGGILLIIIPHAIALGPLPWLMLSELFPTRIRTWGTGVATTVLWTGAWVGASLFPLILDQSEKSIPTRQNIALEGSSFAFQPTEMDFIKIKNPSQTFVDADFKAGERIKVSGASKPKNNGTFELFQVQPDILMLGAGSQLVQEPRGAEITLAGPETSLTSRNISFEDANYSTIRDSKKEFAKAGFKLNQKIAISGASKPENNLVAALKAVTPAELVINSVLVPEAAGTPVRIRVGSVVGGFLVFTVLCVLSLLFGIFMLPETKNRTLEEIAASWTKK